ncbi:hypothetical protein [Mycoplana ramosa]|uniref:Uncharacterized protein n=1 Tax=Mycoplana ramosa TaxID=40837 RepID=A0ABW3YU79_MYCRA
MNSKPRIPLQAGGQAREKIAYIRQMLGELRAVADAEGAEMLRYLIEMAYVEAGDIQAGLRPLSIRGEGNQPAGMAVEPAGKVQF